MLRDAQIANALTEDEARRIASNIAKLPALLGAPKKSELEFPERRRLIGLGFGRRSFILGTSVAGERHPICGKPSMIAWLHIGSLQLANSAPSLAGLFVF